MFLVCSCVICFTWNKYNVHNLYIHHSDCGNCQAVSFGLQIHYNSVISSHIYGIVSQSKIVKKQSTWYIHVFRLLSKQKCNNIRITLLTIRNAITLQKLVSIVKLFWPNHSVQLNALDVFNLKMAEFLLLIIYK